MEIRSVFDTNLFADKVAIVTGGATGIGSAIAHELSYLGCNVMIASRKVERLQEAEDKMKNNERLVGKVASTKCDIRKEEEVKKLMETTIEKFGKIDFLVNNGGGQFVSSAEKISEKGWHAVVETNLTGTFYCCKQAFLMWMRDHGGVIVNITANSWRGIPFMSHTGAARAGVQNLTKTLSLEWASYGIRINSIAPGSIYSPTAAANYAGTNLMELSRQKQLTGRLGNTEEISSAVCFLLSPGASFITGETLKVDGGESLYNMVFEIPKCKKFPVWSWNLHNASKL